MALLFHDCFIESVNLRKEVFIFAGGRLQSFGEFHRVHFLSLDLGFQHFYIIVQIDPVVVELLGNFTLCVQLDFLGFDLVVLIFLVPAKLAVDLLLGIDLNSQHLDVVLKRDIFVLEILDYGL